MYSPEFKEFEARIAEMASMANQLEELAEKEKAKKLKLLELTKGFEALKNTSEIHSHFQTQLQTYEKWKADSEEVGRMFDAIAKEIAQLKRELQPSFGTLIELANRQLASKQQTIRELGQQLQQRSDLKKQTETCISFKEA